MNQAQRSGRPSRAQVTISARAITFSVRLFQQLPFQPQAIQIVQQPQRLIFHALRSADTVLDNPTQRMYSLVAPSYTRILSARLVRDLNWPYGTYEPLVEDATITIQHLLTTTVQPADQAVLEQLDPQRPYTVSQIAVICGTRPPAIYRHIEAGHLVTDAVWTEEFREVIARGNAVRQYLQWRLDQYGWIQPPRNKQS